MIAVVHRLLFVDDEDTLLFTMREYFCDLGYQVDCARTQDEAVGLLAEADYAAVVVDLRLHGHGDHGGLEVLAASGRWAPHARRVVLTAYGSPDIQKQACSIGIDAYLLKPLPLRALADTLERLIDTKRAAPLSD